jgi:hypothetical protein
LAKSLTDLHCRGKRWPLAVCHVGDEAIVPLAVLGDVVQRIERLAGFAGDVGGVGGILVAEHVRVRGGNFAGECGYLGRVHLGVHVQVVDCRISVGSGSRLRPV